jgi:hypothetical protein
MADNWFDVDREGMRKILARRVKWFILTEPIQNALDEPITTLDVDFRHVGRNQCELVVTDDSPTGFQDLADAYTLFKPSKKIGNPTLRGAFNKGCKDVAAFAISGNIETTIGNVKFLPNGERAGGRKKRRSGTQVAFVLRLTKEEYDEACEVIPLLHIPSHVKMTFNGSVIAPVDPIHRFEATLPTMIAKEDGVMRATARKTEVLVYDSPCGQKYIYELGIPVCELGDDKWSLDIQAKVPLNVERDNVTPAYLRKLRVLVFNEMAQRIETPEEANANWAREAAADPDVAKEAFEHSMDLRWGKERVSYDPSDHDAAGIAQGHGAAVIHGRNLSAGEWENSRRFGAVLPAGQVYPSHSICMDPTTVVPEADWTQEQKVAARYWQYVAAQLLGVRLRVEIVRCSPKVSTVANYDKMPGRDRIVEWNIAHKGFPDLSDVALGINEEMDDLMLHELSHEMADSHYGPEILNAATKLGAKLKALVLREPGMFTKEHINRPFTKG